jgi:hypothetical protein
MHFDTVTLLVVALFILVLGLALLAYGESLSEERIARLERHHPDIMRERNRE